MSGALAIAPVGLHHQTQDHPPQGRMHNLVTAAFIQQMPTPDLPGAAQACASNVSFDPIPATQMSGGAPGEETRWAANMSMHAYTVAVY